MQPNVLGEYEKRYARFKRVKYENDRVFSEENTIYLASTSHTQYICRWVYPSKQRLYFRGEIYLIKFIAYKFRKGMRQELKEEVNKRIELYWETGHYVRSNQMLNDEACSQYINKGNQMKFNAIRSYDLAPIFVFYASLLTASCLMKIIEWRKTQRGNASLHSQRLRRRPIENPTRKCVTPLPTSPPKTH